MNYRKMYFSHLGVSFAVIFYGVAVLGQAVYGV
jgi:hypothetical protein